MKDVALYIIKTQARNDSMCQSTETDDENNAIKTERLSSLLEREGPIYPSL